MKLSQLRQDLVSGEWIVIAPKRGERPHDFRNKVRRRRAPIAGCIFENPQGIDHSEPILQFNDKHGWTLQIIENKFPAFTHRDVCSTIAKVGPYSVTDGIGHHDVVITRPHDKDFPDLNKEAALEVFRAFQDRYLMLTHDKCLAYISIFHNWGELAGASIYHPHYQIIAIPVTPPDFEHSVTGAMRFFKKYKTCVHCRMVQWEKEEKKRVIFENKEAIAFTPFISRSSFEIRIFPKKHLPFFENTNEADLAGVIAALQTALKMMKKTLRDPDYNFFIHTAPLANKKRYTNYHWHIEVLPKMNVSAGFELGTGIEINPVDPDEAAILLRS